MIGDDFVSRWCYHAPGCFGRRRSCLDEFFVVPGFLHRDRQLYRCQARLVAVVEAESIGTDELWKRKNHFNCSTQITHKSANKNTTKAQLC